MADFIASDIVGWIPRPDSQSTAQVHNQALNGSTTRYKRYRISHGRANGPGPILIVVVAGDGTLYDDPGNDITNLSAKAHPGGKILLSWQYTRHDAPGTPHGFKIYEKNGDSWDLKDTIGRDRRKWLSGVLTEGLVTHKVRVYKGSAQTPGLTASATADATGPDLISSLTITAS